MAVLIISLCFSYGPGILNLACSFYGKAISKISGTNIYFTSGKILKCHKVEFAWINPLNPITTKFKLSLLLPYVSYRESKEKLLMYQPSSSCAIMFLSYFPEGFSWGILGGYVPPGSPNPVPISDQKMLFSTPVFRSGDGYKTQHYMFT